ncbi:hypothetical protein EDC94DRAFT_591987, partial [Helicostylum pulchrum]
MNSSPLDSLIFRYSYMVPTTPTIFPLNLTWFLFTISSPRTTRDILCLSFSIKVLLCFLLIFFPLNVEPPPPDFFFHFLCLWFFFVISFLRFHLLYFLPPLIKMLTDSSKAFCL